MRHLGVRLTLEQDAALSGQPSSAAVSRSERHVPGATLRGALAAAWIARHGPPSGGTRETFATLFEGGVTFGPLFADGPPVPLSVQRHKGGAAPADCGPPEVDTAVGTELDCCPRLEHWKGATRTAPLVRRRTHVSLDSDGVAVDGALFSRETLRSRDGKLRTVLRGQVSGHAEALAGLREFERIRVGGRRTTHGMARIDFHDTEGPVYGLPEVIDRLLLLRLASPGIFVDDLGRPSTTPDPEEIGTVLGVRVVSIGRAWTRWTSVGGWHSASGLPKPEERCLMAGSTWAIDLESAPRRESLLLLAQRGLGLRRHEGFGALQGKPFVRTSRESS